MSRTVHFSFVAGAVLALLVPQLAQAQAVAAARPANFGYYGTSGQSFYWLFNPQIQKELEVVPEQIEKLTKMRTEMNQKRSELYKSFRELDPNERQKRYREAYRELGEETEKKVKEVLLENQIDRLKQIMLQMRLRNTYGSANAIATEDMAKALGLSEEQKKHVELFQHTMQFYARRDMDKSEAEDKHLFRVDELMVSARGVGLTLHFRPNMTFDHLAAKPRKRPAPDRFKKFFHEYLKYCMSWDERLIELFNAHLAPHCDWLDGLCDTGSPPYLHGVFLAQRT